MSRDNFYAPGLGDRYDEIFGKKEEKKVLSLEEWLQVLDGLDKEEFKALQILSEGIRKAIAIPEGTLNEKE